MSINPTTKHYQQTPFEEEFNKLLSQIKREGQKTSNKGLVQQLWGLYEALSMEELTISPHIPVEHWKLAVLYCMLSFGIKVHLQVPQTIAILQLTIEELTRIEYQLLNKNRTLPYLEKRKILWSLRSDQLRIIIIVCLRIVQRADFQEMSIMKIFKLLKLAMKDLWDLVKQRSREVKVTQSLEAAQQWDKLICLIAGAIYFFDEKGLINNLRRSDPKQSLTQNKSTNEDRQYLQVQKYLQECSERKTSRRSKTKTTAIKKLSALACTLSLQYFDVSPEHPDDLFKAKIQISHEQQLLRFTIQLSLIYFINSMCLLQSKQIENQSGIRESLKTINKHCQAGFLTSIETLQRMYGKNFVEKCPCARYLVKEYQRYYLRNTEVMDLSMILQKSQCSNEICEEQDQEDGNFIGKGCTISQIGSTVCSKTKSELKLCPKVIILNLKASKRSKSLKHTNLLIINSKSRSPSQGKSMTANKTKLVTNKREEICRREASQLKNHKLHV